MSTKNFTLRDGTVLCYEDTEGNGRPVVFIPGWGENRHAFDAYLPIVAGAGYRYLSIDPRSTKETGESKTRPVTLRLLIDDLEDLFKGNNLTDITLVGYSMAVLEVLGYVMFHGTDRLHSIVLLDSPPKLCASEDWHMSMWGGEYSLEEAMKAYDWMTRDMLDYFSTWIFGSSPDIKNAPDPKAAADQWARDYMSNFYPDETAEVYRDSIQFDGRPGVVKIDKPVLYLYPDKGQLCVPGMSDYYKDNIHADFTRKSFDSDSHYFCVEEAHIPAVSEAILEFLKK